MHYSTIAITFAIFSVTCLAQLRVKVVTDKGAIIGKIITYDRINVATFLGIQYAEAPVGKLRFQKPQPKKAWSTPQIALNYGDSCYGIQDNTFKNFRGSELWNVGGNMSEDCLFLNIWSPKSFPLRDNKKLPVMVWIFGGGYYSGSTHLKYDLYNGKRLAVIGNAVIVSINYRLLSLGFMGTSNSQFNNGIYDQLTAIQWVKDYISLFGGDPNSITLFGESAGAASIGYLSLGSLSNKLFQRAIMESSSPNCKWAYTPPEVITQRSENFAKYLGCSTLECLQKLPISKIYQADQYFFKKVNNDPTLRTMLFQIYFTPTKDDNLIKDDPSKTLKNESLLPNNLDIITGFNSNEGSYWLVYYMSSLFHGMSEKPPNISFAEYEIAIKNISTLLPVLQDIVTYEYTYWPNVNDELENGKSIMNAAGEFLFLCDVCQFADAMAAAGNNVYMYYFSRLASLHYWPYWMGVIHGDEIQWVFGEIFEPFIKNGTDYEFSISDKTFDKTIISSWSQFAKSGIPRNGWNKWGRYNKMYMVFSNSSVPSMQTLNDIDRRCGMWNNLLPAEMKYYSLESSCRILIAGKTLMSFAFLHIMYGFM
uniref:Carboxylic ester hydrolase n=1 Tax=Hofstenia miamia TaxID=442651 RepID=A0A7G7LK69_HOFMI|nr:acetylcholinesterase 2 [Hofstenia miamia]